MQNIDELNVLFRLTQSRVEVGAPMIFYEFQGSNLVLVGFGIKVNFKVGCGIKIV